MKLALFFLVLPFCAVHAQIEFIKDCTVVLEGVQIKKTKRFSVVKLENQKAEFYAFQKYDVKDKFKTKDGFFEFDDSECYRWAMVRSPTVPEYICTATEYLTAKASIKNESEVYVEYSSSYNYKGRFAWYYRVMGRVAKDRPVPVDCKLVDLESLDDSEI